MYATSAKGKYGGPRDFGTYIIYPRVLKRILILTNRRL